MRINTFVGSLIGAFAIYGIVAACSSGRGAGLLADAGLIDGNFKDTHLSEGPVPRAEAAPSDCTQWEVKVIHAQAFNTSYNSGEWEPISINLQNSSTGESEIGLRRCVP